MRTPVTPLAWAWAEFEPAEVWLRQLARRGFPPRKDRPLRVAFDVPGMPARWVPRATRPRRLHQWRRGNEDGPHEATGRAVSGRLRHAGCCPCARTVPAQGAGLVSDWNPSLPGFGDPPQNQTLYYGDCYDWMQRWDSQSVDLIYLDPPFNSNQNYNVLYRGRGAGQAQYRAFDDTWHWNNSAEARLAVYRGATARSARRAILGMHQMLGECGMLSYLTYMAERLEQMKRILKPTGSIYLHCDDNAVHYLRSLMDSIFGGEAFRNEIVWQRTGSHSDSKRFGRTGDRILFYGSKGVNRDAVRVPLSPQYVKEKYRYRDGRGLYREDNLTAKGLTGGGYHYDFHGHPGPWRYPKARMVELETDDRIHFPKKAGGVPAFKRYLSDNKGRHLSGCLDGHPADQLTGEGASRLPNPRSPVRCWSGSSRRPVIPAILSLTRSADAGQRWMRPTVSDVGGPGWTFRRLPSI